MLYIELDKADPIIEDLIPPLSHKQPKIIAATLSALTSIYHAYGCKVVDPKPILKVLPKVFGHADKNVRAEASNLVVELYRWLREAMKPLFWAELNHIQQTDLEKLFEAVKQESAPKQERLLKSQQAAVAATSNSGGAAEDGGQRDADGDEMDEDPVEVEAFDLAEPVDAFSKVPTGLHESLASTKWKDRKDSLDALYAVLNVPRIKDGPFNEIAHALAKCMKDANIAVVTVAANCVDVLAKGLRRGFGKYRSTVMGPMMERLKEKKQSVTDALGQAMDSVFAFTSLTDCLEDTLEFLTHKNPNVKSETLKFLIRCLKNTREAPSKSETKSIADAATKLLTESTEATRAGGAEVLGTLMKIMGERAMNPFLDGLDDIRKAKVKEFFEAAEVKAKDKPKKVAPPPKAAPPAQKKVVSKKPALGAKKTATPAPAPHPPVEEPTPTPTPLQPKPTSGRNIPKLSGPSKPGSLKLPKKPTGPGGAAPPHASSPMRHVSPPTAEGQPLPAPKHGLGSRGLAGRPLGKPTATAPLSPAAARTPSPGITAAERAELEELRAEKERLQRATEELRAERNRLASQIHELQNHNASLIEDHTRDHLSIKAKETQLVRARSDAEVAEQTVLKQHRDIDRLKRELARAVRSSSPASPSSSSAAAAMEGGDAIYRDGVNGHHHHRPHLATHPGLGRYDSAPAASFGTSRGASARPFATSPSEEKENGALMDASSVFLKTSSPARTSAAATPGRAGMGVVGGRDNSPLGRGSPSVRSRARGGDAVDGLEMAGGAGGGGDAPVESWKRAAEVTSQLKARIELMKVCLIFSLLGRGRGRD